MNALEARKQALIAESEVYRQTLRLEVQNLRYYGLRVRRRFAALSAFNSLLMLAPVARQFLAPGLGSRRRKPRNRWLRLAGAAFAGWRLYRRGMPLVRTLSQAVLRRDGSPVQGQVPGEEKSPAAGI
jgi:hypothetical protein